MRFDLSGGILLEKEYRAIKMGRETIGQRLLLVSAHGSLYFEVSITFRRRMERTALATDPLLKVGVTKAVRIKA